MNAVLNHPATSAAAAFWRSPVSAWALAVGYFVTGCLMHLQFSLWLVRQRQTVFGSLAFSDAMPALIAAAAAGLLLWLVHRLRHDPPPRALLAGWVLWAAAVLAVDRYLTFSLNEYFHYPQYALLAWLIARAIDPGRRRRCIGRILFWTTLLGMADELLQYLWITTSYSDYLDFNDFVTNLVAAAGGTLLYYSAGAGEAGRAPAARPFAEIAVAAGLSLVVAGALLTGHLIQTPAQRVPPGGIARTATGTWLLSLQRAPGFYGSLQPGFRHGEYYVLPPLAGMLVLLAGGLLFSSCAQTARTQQCPGARRFS